MPDGLVELMVSSGHSQALPARQERFGFVELFMLPVEPVY